jgi:hypothetical protein
MRSEQSPSRRIPHRAHLIALTAVGAISVASHGQCGAPGAGDCCDPHSGSGCADEACCMLVCNSDPYCCDVGWDEYCAGNAAELCGACEPVVRMVMAFGGSTTLPGGIAIDGCDLAAYDVGTGSWSIFLDGDALGLGGNTIAAATAIDGGDLLLALDGGGEIPGLIDGPSGDTVDSIDLIRFTPDVSGRYTAGVWTFHFDGSDVGFAEAGSSITSLSALPDGSLLLSTEEGGWLASIGAFEEQDLVRFVPQAMGATTAGEWSIHLDGSDVGLAHNNEAIDALGTSLDGDLLISTTGNASVSGLSARRGDVMAFMPNSLGASTSGTFALWFDATDAGLSNGDDVVAFATVTVSWPSGPRPGGGGVGGGGGVAPPTACGDQVAGDCCTVHDTPYCADAACCELVCGVDPMCCSTTWDEYCVSAAAELCAPCMPAPLLVGSFGALATLPGGLAVDGCDLAAFNTATGMWSVFFDGDDVGLSGHVIAAASVLENGELILAIEGGGVIGGLVGGPNGSMIDTYDLVRFAPDQLGPTTAGMWHFHFDGSDVGLAESGGQAITGISQMPDGSMLFATQAGGSLPGMSSFKGQDLIRFVPTSLGSATAGAWSLHFDGSDVGLASNNERLDAVFAEADGSLLLSSRGSVSSGSFGAGRSDVFAFAPSSTGSATGGSFSMGYDASQLGLPNGVNLRGLFRTILVDPGSPRPPSTAVTVMFDRMPDAAVHDLAIEQGHIPYIIIYQGTDPSAATTGVIDANRVVEAIRANHGDSPSGYGVLDFENPFFDRLQAGPSDPNYQMTVDTIVNLLETVKAEFPQVEWTMYGMPRLRYWFSNGNWANRTEAEREAELTAALGSYTPILQHVDWLNPSVYDRYELGLYSESSWAGVTARETAYRTYNMELCNRFNAGEAIPKKVVPMVSPMFWKVGNIEYNMKQTPLEELLRDQVRPLIEGGATGIAFWTGYSYWTRIATSAEDFGTFQQEARFSMLHDYLGGVEPVTWVDEQVKLELKTMTSEYVLQRLGEVKAEIEALTSDPGQQGP